MMGKEPTMVVVTKDGTLIGSCVHYPRQDGWQFLPAVTSRRRSCRFWRSAAECLPKWAFDASDEMLTAAEFKAMTS